MSDAYRHRLIKLLNPIVRFCYRRGWKIQQLTELLKLSLLAIAEEDLRTGGSAPNVSRLSVATGLHRRDVMRLWRDEAPPKLESNLLVKIIGLWAESPRYATRSGTPRVLSFEGKASEFALLVSSVTLDLNPYTVLSELERARLVEKTPRGLKLVKPVFSPSDKDIEQGLELLGADISDLVRAVDENVFTPKRVPHLHIKTEYDNIPVDKLPEIQEKLIEEGAAFHSRMRRFLSGFDRDIEPAVRGTGRARVGIGAFSFAEEISLSEKEDSKRQRV